MIIEDESGNVSILPTAKRTKVEVPPLEVVHSYQCRHGRFLVDEKKAEVECGLCHEKLNPIWVLTQIATDDRILRDRWAGMKAEVQLLTERVRTKCDHCGKMTRIRSNVRDMDLRALAEKIKAGEAP